MTAEELQETPFRRGRLRRLVRPVGLLALALACTWIIVGLVGDVDWGSVVDALGGLHLWQLGLLLVVLVVRQVLNATPLAIFIRGLGLRRAVQNDQAATLMSVVAPPPTDMILRLSMFRSWGVPMAEALAGAMMNILTFYVTRFTVPVIGLVLVLVAPVDYHAVYGVTALVGTVVAVVLLVLLSLVIRDDAAAIKVSALIARPARKIKPSVDPEDWAARAVAFRSHVAGRARRGIPGSLALLITMVMVDGMLMALSLRFTGIPAARLGLVSMLAVFLLAYPLTMFPLAGVGILDAIILAALVEAAGADAEPEIVAGLVVYRVLALIVPLAFGVVSLGLWRRTATQATPDPIG